MKFLQKLSGTALLFAALLFTACSKDKDPGNAVTPIAPANQKTCRLIKTIHWQEFHKYNYDNNGRIIKIEQFNNDSTLIGYIKFTYNTAGKVVEEIHFEASNKVELKRNFTYNTSNQLTQIDVYDGKAPGGINQLEESFHFQYNSAGKRILAQHYPGTQASKMDYYSEYNYSQNQILEKRYNAQTVPATVIDTVVIYYDNKKSYNALGYLNAYYPELDKHNVTYIKRNPNIADNSSYQYKYNQLDYPINVEYWHGMFGGGATYEYDCN